MNKIINKIKSLISKHDEIIFALIIIIVIAIVVFIQ